MLEVIAVSIFYKLDGGTTFALVMAVIMVAYLSRIRSVRDFDEAQESSWWMGKKRLFESAKLWARFAKHTLVVGPITGFLVYYFFPSMKRSIRYYNKKI